MFRFGGGLGSESGSQASGIDAATGETRWVTPTDMVTTDKQGKPVANGFSGETQTHFPKQFITPLGAENGQNKLGDALEKALPQTKKIPFYTLPENSTLMGATALTSLVGRVPINGAVVDSYPFKALIGRENLIANGIELPDVEGAVISGTLSGDWTLSCVRGAVKSITFVFQDGRISNAHSSSESNANAERTLGWISNPQGVTCIPGQRRTNAPEYLGSQFLLAGAGAAASSLAQGETTAVVQDGSVIGGVTGSSGRFVLGQALAGGLGETERWYRERYGQTFDAIYVPPGSPIAIHIDKQIEIDYDEAARKVKYNHSQRLGGLD